LPRGWETGAVCLALGDVAHAAEVFVDGQSLGRRIMPPYRYELPDKRKGSTIELDIRVINTPQNVFGQNRVSSGLLGPVQLCFLE